MGIEDVDEYPGFRYRWLILRRMNLSGKGSHARVCSWKERDCDIAGTWKYIHKCNFRGAIWSRYVVRCSVMSYRYFLRNKFIMSLMY